MMYWLKTAGFFCVMGSKEGGSYGRDYLEEIPVAPNEDCLSYSLHTS